MANNNYTSFEGTITFFDDRKPAPLPPPGGSVFRRPPGRTWATVAQIVGEYCEDEIVEYDGSL